MPEVSTSARYMSSRMTSITRLMLLTAMRRSTMLDTPDLLKTWNYLRRRLKESRKRQSEKLTKLINVPPLPNVKLTRQKCELMSLKCKQKMQRSALLASKSKHKKQKNRYARLSTSGKTCATSDICVKLT